MSEMQDYKSSLTDTSSRKFETFSYLPAMDNDGIKKQVEFLVKQGLNPAIEHSEPENAFVLVNHAGTSASGKNSSPTMPRNTNAATNPMNQPIA